MFDKVKNILLNYANVTEITEDSMLEADLGLSSFDVLSIVTEFEDMFEIEISNRDIGKFTSVKDILEYLETHT